MLRESARSWTTVLPSENVQRTCLTRRFCGNRSTPVSGSTFTYPPINPTDVRCVGPSNVNDSVCGSPASHRQAVAGLRSSTFPGPNTIGVPSASVEFGDWHDPDVSRGTTPPGGAANVVVGRGVAGCVGAGAWVGAGAGAAVAAGGAAVAAGGAAGA